ncbi:GNAT family N-acetyltransferase [Paenibacillaceae bacterium]|nr:GNAT family N-acetyltransferase [Paenibacillaceae bacterium]
MQWSIKKFHELTNDELYEILQKRVDVFVVEQECAYKEIDGHDRVAYHLYAHNGSEIAAYLRVLPPGTTYEALSIGRVLVDKNHRKEGLGSELLKNALTFIHKELKESVVKIQAQHHLLSFYGSFGFEQISEVYLDEGIPHIDMIFLKVDL